MPAKLESRLPQISKQVHQALASTTKRAAEDTTRRLHLAMDDQKHGRIYGAHQASAPGEPPASESGKLEGSIKVEPQGDTDHVVYSDDPKAEWLELGTDHIEPRPMWGPVSEIVRSELPQIAREEFEKRVK